MPTASQGQAWMREIVAETLKNMQAYDRDVIDEILLTISEYDVGSLSSRGKNSKKQLRYIVFYRHYLDDREWSKERSDRFQCAVRFAIEFVEVHNNNSVDQLFVVTPKNATIYEKHEDKHSWTPRNANTIGVRFKKSTRFGFFKNSRFYLGGFAHMISTSLSQLVRPSNRSA